MATTTKRSGKKTVAHASTRAKGGRPARQRHSQAQAAHRERSAASSRSNGKSNSKSKYWSHHVMETSDAMDIEKDIFKTGSADEIAQSLKRSSTHSKRRKGTPFQSAMSMLILHQPRRPQPAEDAQEHVAAGQAQAARSIRPRAVITPRVTC